MASEINISDIFDKNLNFLIGAGASYGLLPTLALKLTGTTGSAQTIETLATDFSAMPDDRRYDALFMYYYKACIEPAMIFDWVAAKLDPAKNDVLRNYSRFIDTLLQILQRRREKKSCNIFTTNYDGCFAYMADEVLREGHVDFSVNDGASGFRRRYIQAKNFNNYVYQAGVFDRHHVDLPQINIIHLHGSIYWYKDGENILVDYDSRANEARQIAGAYFGAIDDFSAVLLDGTKSIGDLPDITLNDADRNAFWSAYSSLPIVNPTKWKFHETVFEEHYYQMLRLLSYELEKPNSIFVTFGFSFADEHILNLVKRSLSNPTLQLFICCFDEAEKDSMSECFKIYRNVEIVSLDDFLDFSAFNNRVFTLAPRATASGAVATGSAS